MAAFPTVPGWKLPTPGETIPKFKRSYQCQPPVLLDANRNTCWKKTGMVFGVKNNTFFFSFNKKLSSGFYLVLLNSGSYSPPTQFFFSRTEEPGEIRNKIIKKKEYI